MDSDVLIYLNNLKNYINSNYDYKRYLLGINDEDYYYENIGRVASTNQIKNGEPTLSREQFEKLRFYVKKREKFSTPNGVLCLN